jgi:hypothetical protein
VPVAAVCAVMMRTWFDLKLQRMEGPVVDGLR